MNLSKRVNQKAVFRRIRVLFGAVFLSVALAACESADFEEIIAELPPIVDQGDGNGEEAPTPAPAPTGQIGYTSSGHAEMDKWRTGFSSRALAAGRDRAVVQSILTGISPLSVWLKEAETANAISDQAEFSKPIWDYLRVPLGNTRISTGRDKLSGLSPTFSTLEARYGVDKEVLASIWGMETSYGGYIGDFDAANALANMAVEGRRRSFAEGELLALMKIIERGHADRDELIAGYAGAMGHTQFMPSTYLAHAADYEGDGRIDVWKNPNDALASAANYLKVSGYVPGEPWGMEVLVPPGFDYTLADGQDRRFSTWRSSGVSRINGEPFPVADSKYAQLWLPAGAEGPKYLLMKNFKVFKKYNNANSYAFAIGMAADAIGGATPGPVAAWPTHLKPLTVAEIKTLQSRLNSLGYDAGPVDGIPGRRTTGALQAFQKDRGLQADGYPTKTALNAVLGGKTVSVSAVSGG